jgi:hypothetical protein
MTTSRVRYTPARGTGAAVADTGDLGGKDWERYNYARRKKEPAGAPMTADDVKAKLLKEIHLRGYDDHYIDRNEEREILQIALQLGESYDAARADMTAVCASSGYVLESGVVRALGERVKQAGVIDRAAFEQIVSDGVQLVQGKKTDRDVRALLVTVVDDTATVRVKRGWFGDWYKSLKKELGLG